MEKLSSRPVFYLFGFILLSVDKDGCRNAVGVAVTRIIADIAAAHDKVGICAVNGNGAVVSDVSLDVTVLQLEGAGCDVNAAAVAGGVAAGDCAGRTAVINGELCVSVINKDNAAV